MSLASAPGIALGFLAWACALHASVDAQTAGGEVRPAKNANNPHLATEPQAANAPQDAPRAADLSRERQLVEEALAAAREMDLSKARAKAGEAIGLLLARPESEHDAGWLDHLDAAGYAASEAQDPRAARAAWEVVLEVRSRTLPDDHPDLQWARGNLANKLRTLGDLATARQLEEKVLEVRSRTLPDEHPDLQKARANLAATIAELGDLAAARALQEKVLEVRSRTLPDDHFDLQLARGNLANTLMALGDIAAARTLEEKVFEVYSRTLPDDHPRLQASRSRLARLRRTLGDLAAARTLQEKVLEVCLRTLPEEHRDLQLARDSLGTTLYVLGDLARARALQEQALQVLSRTVPDDNPFLQRVRVNLASSLLALGDLAAARALQEKAIVVSSRALPDDHLELQAARGNLALTLRTLGDFAAARALQEKVLEVLSRTLADDHPSLQNARANLALTLGTLGNHEAARTLQEKVLEIRSRTLPDDHPSLQAARGGLASTLGTLGTHEAARTLKEKVLEVQSRTLPDGHPHQQSARLNLAQTLRSQGDLPAARALQEKAVQVLSRTLPEDDPRLREQRMQLAFTLAAQRAMEKSGDQKLKLEEEGGGEAFARLAGSFTRAIAHSARAAVLTAPSREAEERCASLLVGIGCALSFAEGLGVFPRDPLLERAAFVLSEETRGAALASAQLSRHASADERYGVLREAIRTASAELVRRSQQDAGPDEIDRARGAREAAEKELAHLVREIPDAKAIIVEFDPASLSASISGRSALVGYRRYTRWAYEVGKGSKANEIESVCAFILRAGDRLDRIDLGPIEPIERAVDRWREAIGVRMERGVAAASRAADESLQRGKELRMLVFDPLRPALEETDRVVVALDDVLHLVPLDALPLDGPSLEARPPEPSTPDLSSGLRLGDRWRIETRCTLSELAGQDTALPHREALLAFGGASFNLAPLPPSSEESAALDVEPTGPTEVASILRGSAWDRGFGPLAHSGPEARGIAQLYGEAFDEKHPALVLEKRKASRGALVELAPKARFLHIATHGWFAPESVRSIVEPEPLDKLMGFGARMSGEERARGLSPMLLCGLALAGANLSEDELGRAPGLITAEELSTLDLAGCELAVLSACDTNVGERRGGQGVASLQKALHMAGARTVITSLWKVPDEATRELMLDFYRRIWIEKKPKGVALWEAKMKIRNTKDERGNPLFSTRDWAAWVLTGDPR